MTSPQPKIFGQISLALSQKNLKNAKKLFSSAEKMYPNLPLTFFYKGMIEQQKGSDKRDVVFRLWEKAFKSGLEDLDFLNVYAMLANDLSIWSSACEAYWKMIQIKHDDYKLYYSLSSVLAKMGNPVTAISVLKTSLKVIKPNDAFLPFIFTQMAGNMIKIGCQEEAVQCYEASLTTNDCNRITSYLFHLNYVDMNREKNFELYEKYRTAYEKEIIEARPPFPQTEKIKIGFVSADFYRHPISYFMSGLFEHYDRDKFEFHCFSHTAKDDDFTEFFKKNAAKWHEIAKLKTLKDVAELIRKEQITVLIDLMGHSSKQILPLFAFRPAPVQATYCGYPNTTGLKSIDYRISDKIAEPEDAQKYHSEKLYKLDGCFLCFNSDLYPSPPQRTDVEPVNRPVIFGCFNNLSKISPKTIRAWSKALLAVPNSKLKIKDRALEDPQVRELVLHRFSENGIPANRIEVIGFTINTAEHLKLYNEIDIALDAFPYNGTTTTCDALNMGCPVITILGDRHVSRVSASLLHTVGLPELVARDEDEFVKIAADLATNTKKLATIKENLAERVKKSPLMDKIAFSKKFQNALLDMIAEVKNEN